MIDINKYTNGEELFDGQYKLLRRLSTAGGTADVWLALAVKTIDTLGEYSEDKDIESTQEDSGMKVAIKIYRLQNILDLEGEQRFKDEFKIVYNCHHANLLPPSHFSIFDDAPYLVMPYCKEGSSEKLIGREKDSKVLWKYISDVASGLAYLHACNPPIIHQDIKPANVLIDSNGNFAITDFGISAKIDNCSKNYYEDASSGTLVYMAPERFLENAIPQPESDIWALGATLYEIVTGDVPFGNDGGMAQLDGQAIPVIKENIPKDLKKLIYSCLDKDPKKRPTAKDISNYIVNKRIRKNWINSIAISSICVIIIALTIILRSSTTRTSFEKFNYSGDSIISIIKTSVVKNTFEVDNNSESMFYEASKYFKAANSLIPENKEVIRKIETSDSIMILYKEYYKAINAIEESILLDAPKQQEKDEQWRDDIRNQIMNKIKKIQ